MAPGSVIADRWLVSACVIDAWGGDGVPLTRAVLEVAEQFPDRLAIVEDTERMTYAQLVTDSQRVFAAAEELHRGLRGGQTRPPVPAPEAGGIPMTAVSLTSAFHTARIVAGLAGFRAVSATIDPRWPLEHQVGVVISTGIGVVISDSAELGDALSAAGWAGTTISLADFRHMEGQTAPAAAPTVRSGDEPFLMLFSSGTTRNPKAFVKTRHQYRENFAVSSAYLRPLPGVATLAPGPVSYSLTLYALIECLASGGSAHMSGSVDPIVMSQRIHTESITRVVAVPAMVQALTNAARRNPERFETLELVITGGANLSATIRDGLAQVLPRVELISYYGAAEIGFIGDSRSGDGTTISLYDGIEASVRDDAGAPMADGELGTVWIQAAACSDGYVTGTAQAPLKDAAGWATVHDQGRLVGRSLELSGRSGDIVVTGGHKVSLPEVERAFDGMPELGDVCAVALPSDRMGTVVALVIEGSAPRKEQLVAYAHQRLAPQFVPRRWYRMTNLPRTVGGKIRRGEAADMVDNGAGEMLL